MAGWHAISVIESEITVVQLHAPPGGAVGGSEGELGEGAHRRLLSGTVHGLGRNDKLFITTLEKPDELSFYGESGSYLSCNWITIVKSHSVENVMTNATYELTTL